jgi:ATP-dependent RNA helicase DDX10/DBP4
MNKPSRGRGRGGFNSRNYDKPKRPGRRQREQQQLAKNEPKIQPQTEENEEKEEKQKMTYKMRQYAHQAAELEMKVKQMTPPRGVNPFSKNSMKHKNKEKEATIEKVEEITRFDQLPLSYKTKDALTRANYEKMTEIQASSLLHSLGGRDILGAAKTGSGKTLAFIIPVLENLFRRKWTKQDGLGALILSPSRELALQIFEVLRTVGKYHTFSAGLVVGGVKNFEEEKQHIVDMNILVATPGRLLQHMDKTFGFNTENLMMLVLDEADRLLEYGFKDEVNAVISNLPKERQTLLFSATQTKSIKDLARLSLKVRNG